MILLLNPPGKELHQRSSRWGGRKNRSGIVAPPIFLATAASVLEKSGIDTLLLDSAAEGLSWEDTISVIREKKPGVVVLEVSTTSIDQDSELSGEIRKHGCSVVFVGAHVSALPAETLENYKADVVCVGEYEFTLPELYSALVSGNSLRNVKGIAFRHGGEVVVTEPGELKSLDEFPIPDYEHLPVKEYYDPVARNHPWIAIRTMRGCPFRCSFCVAPQLIYKRTIRYRNPRLVVDEIEYLMKRFRIREFFIDDETFTVSRKHVFGVCEELKRRGLKIEWSVFSRCDTIDEERLRELRSAGCYLIRYGIESADQEILDRADKGIRVEQIEKAFALTKRHGFKIHATVMLGLDGETGETIRKTLDFVKRISPDYVQFAIATPYPGTKFYSDLKSSGRILTDNWEEYDGSCRSVIRLDGLDSSKLGRIVNSAYRDFYFRPSFMVKKLLSIRSFGELYHAVKSGIVLMRSF